MNQGLLFLLPYKKIRVKKRVTGSYCWCFLLLGCFYCLLQLSCDVVDIPVGVATKLSANDPSLVL